MKSRQAIDKIGQSVIESGLCKAIILKGSFGRGDYDEYSDVDMCLIASDNTYDDLLKRRLEFLNAYKSIVYTEHLNFGLPQILAIYEDAVHVDLYVASLEQIDHLDPIEVYYDPEQIFKDYKPTREEMTIEELKPIFESVLYDFVEADTAYSRKNYPWAAYIMSNALACCAKLLRWNYDKKYAFLGLKKINEILPVSEYSYIEDCNTYLHGNDFHKANILIIKMLELFCSRLSEDELKRINVPFYHWIEKNINRVLFK